MTILLALVLIVGSVGVLLGSAKPAAADTTVFAPGQVFASVGNSTVNVYDPTSGNLLDSLVDNTNEPYTVGTAFNSQGDLFVADDLNGDISEFGPDGTPLPTFATGLSNPISMAFDNQGNMYVGQQTTPYIAEFAPDGTRLTDIGPLQTELYGDDWIDLASDECTFYYTTEGTDILTYNKCTNTQGPNFNKVPFPSTDPSTGLPVNAFEVKLLSDGDVLVADSNAVLLLDSNGNVIQTYPCSSLPNCGGQLFAVSVDPSGTAFWTGDSASGDIYEINIATGALIQTIATHEGLLYGLSVAGNLSVATPPQTTTTVPSTLSIQPVAGNFSTPTPVSAVLTNPDTSTPIVNEPVTFTLNGSATETCTADTDATGTATCDITASEPSTSYTLNATFPGDSTASTPIGSDSTSSTFTVNPDTSSLSYTGPTTGVNGQPITLSGTLTTNTPSSGTPLPTKVVTFTVGSGTTSQSCNAVTDSNGNVSCTIASLDQTQTDVTVSSTFSGDSYDTPSTVSTPATVTEPTILTVSPTTSDYSDTINVLAVLTDANTNAPIANETVTLTLNNTETCTATTDASGTASCPITPGEPAATYTLTGSFGGDSTLPLQLTSSTGSANFVVTLEETELTYTGGTVAQNGQPLTVSGVLTSDEGATPLGGQPVTFTLGTGSSAQTCTGTTLPTGSVSCTIAVAGQPQGPIPVTDNFAGNAYYKVASDAATVNLPEGTTLTVSPGSGTYNGSTTITGTLVNSYTNQPVTNEPVTLTVNGSQTCTGTTNASGVASCSVTTTEPPGTYSLSGSFGGTTVDHTCAPLFQWIQHVRGEQSVHHGDLHREHLDDVRPAAEPVGHAHDGERHAAVGPDRDLHGRLGIRSPALLGDDQLGGHGELQHLQLQPEHQPAACHRDLRRQHVLLVVDHVTIRHGDHTDHPVSERHDGHLRSTGGPDGHPDQLGDGAGYQRADDHAHAERRPDLHRHDREHRQGVVHRDADRALGHLPGHRLLRRQHDHLAATDGE